MLISEAEKHLRAIRETAGDKPLIMPEVGEAGVYYDSDAAQVKIYVEDEHEGSD